MQQCPLMLGSYVCKIVLLILHSIFKKHKVKTCLNYFPCFPRPARKGCLKSASGSSGETCAGLLEYIRSHRPGLLILENVEELTQAADENADFLLEQLRGFDYDADIVILKSSHYGSPQRRVRAYVVAYHGSQGHAKLAVKLAEKLAVPQIDLASFVYQNESDYLKSEFKRRTEQKEQKEQKAHRAEEAEGAEVEDLWRAKYQSQLANSGMSVSSCMPPKEISSLPWFQLLTQRQQFVLGHALSEKPNLKSVDVFPSMAQEFISVDAQEISTIVPNSVIWCTTLERCLLGAEMLRIQMMPSSIIDAGISAGVTDHLLADLAGNAFTGSVFSAVLIAALVHSPCAASDAAMPSATVVDEIADIFDL